VSAPSDADEKPGDAPAPFRERSGVTLTIEPSKALLDEIDRFCARSTKRTGRATTREAALLFFAFTGATASKFMGEMTDRLKKKPEGP
jgi:hypothetical protein